MEVKCKICRRKSELCNSHAIPDSLFRSIFRKNSGQAIELSNLDEKPIKYTQDSWATEQLCERCENRINENYEQYSLKALSGKTGSFERLNDGVYFKSIKTQTIRDFIIAILWRASLSSNDAYKAVSLPSKINESIRLALSTSSSVSKKTISIRGFKLIDTTEGGFHREALRELIISPFLLNVFNDSKSGKVICFVFLGYLFEVFINAYPKDSSYRAEFIGFDKRNYLFKYQEITEIPEVFDLIVQSYSKYVAGHSTIKC